MTKKQIIKKISDILRWSGKEIIIKDFYELRIPRGLHAYSIGYSAETGNAQVYPWYKAGCGWDIPADNISKARLELLCETIRTECE